MGTDIMECHLTLVITRQMLGKLSSLATRFWMLYLLIHIRLRVTIWKTVTAHVSLRCYQDACHQHAANLQ